MIRTNAENAAAEFAERMFNDAFPGDDVVNVLHRDGNAFSTNMETGYRDLILHFREYGTITYDPAIIDEEHLQDKMGNEVRGLMLDWADHLEEVALGFRNAALPNTTEEDDE